MKIFDQITVILSQLCGATEITAEHRLQQDLGLDSLQLVTLLLMIEEGFQIVLKEADMNPFDLTTVAQAVELVEKYRKEK